MLSQLLSFIEIIRQNNIVEFSNSNNVDVTKPIYTQFRNK